MVPFVLCFCALHQLVRLPTASHHTTTCMSPRAKKARNAAACCYASVDERGLKVVIYLMC